MTGLGDVKKNVTKTASIWSMFAMDRPQACSRFMQAKIEIVSTILFSLVKLESQSLAKTPIPLSAFIKH